MFKYLYIIIKFNSNKIKHIFNYRRKEVIKAFSSVFQLDDSNTANANLFKHWAQHLENIFLNNP